MEPNSIICNNCSSENRPQAIYCHECGQVLIESDTIKESISGEKAKKTRKSRFTSRQTTVIILLLIFLFLAFITAGGLIGYWIYSGGGITGIF